MLVDDDVSRVIPVNDILFNIANGDGHVRASDSDGDDKPIAATLHALPKAGSAEVQAKKRRKRPKKTLWSYELVAEPTGIASKYWDANAPGERATKVLANERLTELHMGEDEVEQQPPQLQPTNIEDVPELVEISNAIPPVPPRKKTKRTEVAAATRKQTSARTAQERRADLQSFMATRRRLDNAVTTAQVTKAPNTTSTSMQDTSVVNARPAREPFTCTIPPAGKKAIGTLIASEFPGFAPVV